MMRIPTLLSEAESFNQLSEAHNYDHIASWVDESGKLEIDLFIDDQADVLDELCVRYNGIEIAIFNANAYETQEYLSNFNVKLRG